MNINLLKLNQLWAKDMGKTATKNTADETGNQLTLLFQEAECASSNPKFRKHFTDEEVKSMNKFFQDETNFETTPVATQNAVKKRRKK